MKTTIIQDDSNELKPERSETTEEVGVRRHPTNLSGRMGRWSAHHRKTAILGWLAFVVASFFVGSSVIGAKQATDTSGPGESGRALTILDDGFKQPASESVLVQSDTLKTTAPEFVAATRAVVAALERQARGHEHPLPARAGRTQARSRPTDARPSSTSRSAATPTSQSTRSIRSSQRSLRRRRHILRSSSAPSAMPASIRSSRGPSWTTSRRPASTRSRSR